MSGALTGFLGRLKKLWFLKCEESEDKIFVKVKKWRLKISLNFPHVKTELWRPTENVKIKCEDCILKCEDHKIKSGWLDPHVRSKKASGNSDNTIPFIWLRFISYFKVKISTGPSRIPIERLLLKAFYQTSISTVWGGLEAQKTATSK